jgi:hypothetical protein
MDDPSTVGSTHERPPTERLWDYLARPVDSLAAAEALLGMAHGDARALAAVLLLSSPEAGALLDAMPALSRSLSLSTISRSERSAGEIRGPILWSETIAARSASAGDPGTFVFALTSRAYDTPENRVLVSALRALRGAAKTVEPRALREHHAESAAVVADRSLRAHRWLEHRALIDVSAQVTRRDRQRARTSARRRQYAVAGELLARQAVPLSPAQLAAVADTATTAQLWGLVALLDGLRQRRVPLPPLRLDRGLLEGGPIRYVHPRSRPARSREATAGTFLADRAVQVATAGDAAAALDRAGF